MPGTTREEITAIVRSEFSINSQRAFQQMITDEARTKYIKNIGESLIQTYTKESPKYRKLIDSTKVWFQHLLEDRNADEFHSLIKGAQLDYYQSIKSNPIKRLKAVVLQATVGPLVMAVVGATSGLDLSRIGDEELEREVIRAMILAAAYLHLEEQVKIKYVP